jgi:putative transposase
VQNQTNTQDMLTLQNLQACLGQLYDKPKIVQFLDIFNSFLICSINTTTRSLSRYSDQSLRSWFRFLSDSHDWSAIRVQLFGYFVFDSKRTYIYVADESVEGKSGKSSFGLGKFYSSAAGKTIDGICFFCLSLVDVASNTSYMLGVEQVVYTEEDKLRIAADKAKKSAKEQAKKEGIVLSKGRKKGSKNKVKEENPTASFRVFKLMFNKVVGLLSIFHPSIKVQFLVLDTAYGTVDYYKLAETFKLNIISKLKYNACLHFPAETENIKGRPRIYGQKVDIKQLPLSCLKDTTIENGYKTETYQFKAHAKNTFAQKLLNIVVQKKTRLSDGNIATNIWFSTDLTIGFETLLKYYGLRFQIEFDFRDAKQHFGLSDFKNYKENNLTNFINLSFTMCLLSKVQLDYHRDVLKIPKLSIIDLKLIYKARFTAKNILKLVRNQHIPIFNEQFCEQFIPEDLINAA